MTNDDRSERRIIAFYGFKGGAGRSLLLANIAAALAIKGKNVLIIDADLEAPGVGDFFDGPERPTYAQWREAKGLLELFRDKGGAEGEATDPEFAEKLTEALFAKDGRLHPDRTAPGPERYLTEIRSPHTDRDGHGCIRLLGPGSQSAATAGEWGPRGYVAGIVDFDWTYFFTRQDGGDFLRALRQAMLDQEVYDHILIDARTGYNTASVFLVRALATDVVTVSTFSMQSLDGVLRMLPVFSEPLPFTRKGARNHLLLSKRVDSDSAGSRSGSHERKSELEAKRSFLKAALRMLPGFEAEDGKGARDPLFHELPFFEELQRDDSLIFARDNPENQPGEDGAKASGKAYAEALGDYKAAFFKFLNALVPDAPEGKLYRDADSDKEALFKDWSVVRSFDIAAESASEGPKPALVIAAKIVDALKEVLSDGDALSAWLGEASHARRPAANSGARLFDPQKEAWRSKTDASATAGDRTRDLEDALDELDKMQIGPRALCRLEIGQRLSQLFEEQAGGDVPDRAGRSRQAIRKLAAELHLGILPIDLGEGLFEFGEPPEPMTPRGDVAEPESRAPEIVVSKLRGAAKAMTRQAIELPFGGDRRAEAGAAWRQHFDELGEQVTEAKEVLKALRAPMPGGQCEAARLAQNLAAFKLALREGPGAAEFDDLLEQLATTLESPFTPDAPDQLTNVNSFDFLRDVAPGIAMVRIAQATADPRERIARQARHCIDSAFEKLMRIAPEAPDGEGAGDVGYLPQVEQWSAYVGTIAHARLTLRALDMGPLAVAHPFSDTEGRTLAERASEVSRGAQRAAAAADPGSRRLRELAALRANYLETLVAGYSESFPHLLDRLETLWAQVESYARGLRPGSDQSEAAQFLANLCDDIVTLAEELGADRIANIAARIGLQQLRRAGPQNDDDPRIRNFSRSIIVTSDKLGRPIRDKDVEAFETFAREKSGADAVHQYEWWRVSLRLQRGDYRDACQMMDRWFEARAAEDAGWPPIYDYPLIEYGWRTATQAKMGRLDQARQSEACWRSHQLLQTGLIGAAKSTDWRLGDELSEVALACGEPEAALADIAALLDSTDDGRRSPRIRRMQAILEMRRELIHLLTGRDPVTVPDLLLDAYDGAMAQSAVPYGDLRFAEALKMPWESLGVFRGDEFPSPYRLERANLRLLYAETLLRRGRSGDADKAETALREVIEVSFDDYDCAGGEERDPFIRQIELAACEPIAQACALLLHCGGAGADAENLRARALRHRDLDVERNGPERLAFYDRVFDFCGVSPDQS
ncbi:KGGVGR-motif variant AAA ATPase [Acidimangrovimonas pyrenivorans]|uniref:KGGVGR-motif variant AAA ATPase n=1 Tax=Acidimangrovimonas pyrenivorans TaxID=2030798 RepID=A0ABV7AE15_9RHOB